MKTIYKLGILALFTVIFCLFTACEQPTDTPKVTLTGITANYTGGSVAINTDVNSLKSNVTVTAQYSNNTTKPVTDYSLSGDLSASGQKTVTVTYEGKTTTFTVTVSEPHTEPGCDCNGVAEDCDCEDCECDPCAETNNDITYTATRADGEDGVTDTTAINFTFSASVTGFTADDITVTNGTGSVTKGALSGSGTSWTLGVTVTTAGNVTVSISKTGIEAETKDVTVFMVGQIAPTLTGITANYTGGSVAINTDVNSLKSNVTVTAQYSDNSTKAVTDYSLSGDLSASGQKTVTVTYEGKETTFDVTVSEPHTEPGCDCNGVTEDCDCEDCECDPCVTAAPTKTLTGITLNTDTVTRNYNQNETLNLNGLVVTVNYSDTTNAIVSTYTTSPTNGSTLSNTGTITVTVNYTEGGITQSNTFTVTVASVTPAKTLTSITLDTASVKKDYNLNEQLNLSGLVVTANYSDGPGATVTTYTTSPTNGSTLSTAGQITVTVNYTEGGVTRSNSFIVTVTNIAVFTVTNTNEWNAAITAIKNGGDNKNYTITINGDVGVAGSDAYTFGDRWNLTVTLQGNGKLYLTSVGSMLKFRTNTTLTLDSPNLTLQGLTSGQNNATSNNTAALVYVDGNQYGNGTLIMNSGTITGNNNAIYDYNGVSYDPDGGGVYVSAYGNFTMNGGAISGNTATRRGGGVYVTSGSSFTMNGGTISGNSASSSEHNQTYGGGVHVSGTFTMNDGIISGNTVSSTVNQPVRGGGVYVYEYGTFTMNGGIISGNTANVYNPSNVSMNSAYGGGVYVASSGTFRIVTGTVYGSDEADTSLRNTATWRQGSGTTNTGSGAALYVDTNGTSQRGTFSGATWNSFGNLSASMNTIKVTDGLINGTAVISVITAPAWFDGKAAPLTAPVVGVPGGQTVTAQGWQINNSGWTDFTPPATADMSLNNKQLRYYAAISGGSTLYSNTVTITVIAPPEMVFVPGGTFQLGKDLGTATTEDVTPVSNVTISGFYIGKYEVTQAQWQAIMGTTIQQLQTAASGGSTNYGRGDTYPVYYVSWYNALVFCNKLSILEGLTPAYRISNSTNPDDWGTVPTDTNVTWNAATIVEGSTGYRLPTEAQWEYAAKGGDPTAPGWVGYTYAGSDNPDEVAWYGGNSGYASHTVGTKAANGLGIYDMSGNVEEWCWDWNNYYTNEAKTDPTGASSGGNRVKRGGAWSTSAVYVEYIRSASRNGNAPYARPNNVGFRLARPAN